VARILIAGAGALGSVFGGFLRAGGHSVTLLGRAAHMEAIAAEGLHIDGIWGTHRVEGFEVATDALTVRGPFDAVLVAVKSFDTRAMMRSVAPLLSADGVVISLQNGLGNVEVLVDAVGEQRVLAGRVIFGAAAPAPGRVRVTVYAEPVLIGAWSGRAAASREAAQAWAERFAAVDIPSAYCEDIVAALWGKVLYNAALNPLGALLGLHYGALAGNADTRAVMDAVIQEAFAVAVAEQVSLPWESAAAYRAVFYERLVPSTFDHRSSMLQDIERGRSTEIDAINGAVWQRGVTHGIVTPTNELLTRLVRARQAVKSGAQR